MISYKNYESVDEYHDQRFDLIRRLEGTVVNPYYDQEGIPTIGVGFNLSDSGVRERVFEGIGLVTNFSGMSALEIAQEQFYQRQIINTINNRPDDEALFRNQINSIMQSRADDAVLQNAEPPLELRSTFSYSAGETGLQEMK